MGDGGIVVVDGGNACGEEFLYFGVDPYGKFGR